MKPVFRVLTMMRYERAKEEVSSGKSICLYDGMHFIAQNKEAEKLIKEKLVLNGGYNSRYLRDSTT